jgi:hypothetical protein
MGLRIVWKDVKRSEEGVEIRRILFANIREICFFDGIHEAASDLLFLLKKASFR